MTPADLLRELHQLGAVVVTDRAGVARATGTGQRPSDEVLAAVERYRWLLSWGLEGARSGHAWCACSGCGEPMLLRKPGRRCPVTLGCKGTMQLVPGPSFDHRAVANEPMRVAR